LKDAEHEERVRRANEERIADMIWEAFIAELKAEVKPE
jgi:hypothetical protein